MEKAASGRKPGGKPPKAPTPGPRPEDQINLTDEQSRIMPVAGGGFEQSFNAQALVETETLLVVVPRVVQAANDEQQITAMLERIAALPEDLPKPQQLLADSGFFSEANVAACEAAGIELLIALARNEHHPHWSERFTLPEAPPPEATPLERMAHRLKTRTGRATYGLRKQTVEPVFGIIKSVMGLRQLVTRGLDNVQNESHRGVGSCAPAPTPSAWRVAIARRLDDAGGIGGFAGGVARGIPALYHVAAGGQRAARPDHRWGAAYPDGFDEGVQEAEASATPPA